MQQFVPPLYQRSRSFDVTRRLHGAPIPKREAHPDWDLSPTHRGALDHL